MVNQVDRTDDPRFAQQISGNVAAVWNSKLSVELGQPFRCCSSDASAYMNFYTETITIY